jgi:hypothetical protein
MINMLKDEARRAEKEEDPHHYHEQFKIILEGQITILNKSSSNSSYKDSQKRFPLTGTTEEVNSDLQRIKE